MRGAQVALGILTVLALAVSVLADSQVRALQLSLVTGAVEIQLPGGHGWRPALPGTPLSEGESIRTLASGRAEVQLENGSIFRLIPNSEITLTSLALSGRGGFRTTAQVDSGTVFFTLRKGDDRDLRVDLNNGAQLVPGGRASFRISAGTVEVFHGNVQLAGGERLPLTTAAPDPWTRWSQNRDQYYARVLRAREARDLIAPVVTRWAIAHAAMPQYTGTGLRYTADASCPWTQVGGTYADWCWTEARGWFHPAAPPRLNAAAAALASDLAQTHGTLLGLQTQNGLQSNRSNSCFAYAGPGRLWDYCLDYLQGYEYAPFQAGLVIAEAAPERASPVIRPAHHPLPAFPSHDIGPGRRGAPPSPVMARRAAYNRARSFAVHPAGPSAFARAAFRSPAAASSHASSGHPH